MKIKGKGENGISLIVLVITIIVMIILAGAIILSLNSSGIIGRANEARNKSDIANKKEAVNMFEAEYRIKTATGKINRIETTLEDYVKKRMEEEGLDSSEVFVTEDGIVLINPSGMKAEKAGVEIGANVEGYTVTKKTYTTSGKEMSKPDNTLTTATVSNKTDFNWVYIGNDKNGNMLITPDVSEGISDWPTIKLGNQGGYLYGADEINNACKELYSTNKGTARCMNIDDINMILGYTGPKGGYYTKSGSYTTTGNPKTIKELAETEGEALTNVKTPNGVDTWEELGSYKSDYYSIPNSSDKITNMENKSLVYPTSNKYYWLASPCVNARFNNSVTYFYLRNVSSFSVNAYYVFDSRGGTPVAAGVIRPVVLLTSDVEISYDVETNICTIE